LLSHLLAGRRGRRHVHGLLGLVDTPTTSSELRTKCCRDVGSAERIRRSATSSMNYSNMTTAALQSSISISLPPISSIDFHTHLAHRSEPEVVQPLPPPPPAQQRVLPPLPYPYAARQVPPPVPPPPMPHEYMQARPIYPGIPSPYQPMPGRMPLPSTTDPSLIVAPPRHKAKEVKRRTKTGCLTCRKRRIKVSYDSHSLCVIPRCCSRATTPGCWRPSHSTVPNSTRTAPRRPLGPGNFTRGLGSHSRAFLA
jgi:hypothetical protein